MVCNGETDVRLIPARGGFKSCVKIFDDGLCGALLLY